MPGVTAVTLPSWSTAATLGSVEAICTTASVTAWANSARSCGVISERLPVNRSSPASAHCWPTASCTSCGRAKSSALHPHNRQSAATSAAKIQILNFFIPVSIPFCGSGAYILKCALSCQKAFCNNEHRTKYNFRAIPHNSKCRYGERGAADAKPKAQIILDAAKVSAASGGNSEPKQGQRSQSARGFCPRSTMRVPQPDIIEHFGNADAVPQPPERCLSRQAGIVRYYLRSQCSLSERHIFSIRT